MRSSEHPLTDALNAFQEGRDDDVHAALAEAWRRRRAPSLARLAELADARTPSPMAARLTALAAPRVADALERFRTLDREDDPLLASWVLHALEEPPFTGPSSRPLLEALVDAAERLRDPRLLDRSGAIARVWEVRVTPKPSRVALTKRLERAAASVAKAPPAGASEDEVRLETALAEKLQPIASTEQTAADLLAHVYANPNDDAPRLVLADFLLERGDPRGELIMLQMKRRDSGLDATASAREQELLKKHGKAWLGPLAPAVSWGKGYSRSRFERGFLSTVDIILSVGKKLEVMLDDPSWAVVEKFEGGVPQELLYRAPLRALRSLGCSTESLAELAKRKRVFPSVEELTTVEDFDDWESLRAVFPALRTVMISFRLGPTVADVARALRAPVHRLAFERWFESEERRPAIPFEVLVEGVLALEATVPEIALLPPFRHRPRPAFVELRAVAGRYAKVEPSSPR